MNKYNDSHMTQNKIDMLTKLNKLKLQGNQLSRDLTVDSTYGDVVFEYQLQQYLNNMSHGLDSLRKTEILADPIARVIVSLNK